MYKSLLLASCFFSQLAAAATYIQLNSDPEDNIGQGQTLRLDEGLILIGSSDYIQMKHSSGFEFNFLPPGTESFRPGAYKNAVGIRAYDGIGAPKLQVSYPNKFCSQIFGEFIIYEFDVTKHPKKIALDFIQYCDSRTAKLTGSIRYNSDIPDPYTGPLAHIRTQTPQAKEGTSVLIHGLQSYARQTQIVSYQWSQISGKKIEFNNTDTAEVTVKMPTDVALGGEQATIRLTVTDNLGQQDHDDFNLTVSSKSDPETYFSFIEAYQTLANARQYHFDTNNHRFNLAFFGDNMAYVGISHKSNRYSWSADFAAPPGEQLKPGDYLDATNDLSPDPGVPILSVSKFGDYCENSEGSFSIKNLNRAGTETDRSFRASFKQRCRNGHILEGDIAVNAIHESVPVADAGKDVEAKGNTVIYLNASGSSDKSGSLSRYQWSINDPKVSIQNADKPQTTVRIPELADGETSKTYQATVVVTDNEGYKARDTVKITVLANNKAPQANNDSFELEIGKSLNLSLQKNDTDTDGRIASDSIELVKQPQSGTVKINADGTVLYSHTGTVAGNDSFSYRMKDNDGAWSNEATVNISIKQKVDIPVEKPAETKGGSGGSWSFSALLLLMLTLFNRNKLQLRQPQN